LCARDAPRLMSRFFKSAAFPILIVIVLAFFASKLISHADQAPATDFSTFEQQIASGQIDNVVIHTKDDSVDVTLKGQDHKKYTIGSPESYMPTPINQLRQAHGHQKNLAL